MPSGFLLLYLGFHVWFPVLQWVCASQVPRFFFNFTLCEWVFCLGTCLSSTCTPSTQRGLISKTKLSMFALGISCMTFTMLKFVFFYNECGCFIVKVCLVLLNGYSESLKIIVSAFLSFINVVYYNKWFFYMLNHLCILEKHFIWLWHMILLTWFWI